MSNTLADNLAPPKSPIIRRRSLQLPQNLSVPIPPTLKHSPYLNSTDSIFQRNVQQHHTPTEEDEQWLQDTIPLNLDHHLARGGDRKRGRLSISSVSSDSTSESIAESLSKTSKISNGTTRVRPKSTQLVPPHSPPIDYWKHHYSHIVPPPWRQSPVRVHSAPCIAVEAHQ